MIPVKNELTTVDYGKPDDWREELDGPCATLPVQKADGVLYSYWRPSTQELAFLLAGGDVRLGIHGNCQPVVSVEAVLVVPVDGLEGMQTAGEA